MCTTWHPSSAFETFIVFLDDSKLERENVGVRGEREFQLEPSKSVLDGSDVLNECHVEFTHPTQKKLLENLAPQTCLVGFVISKSLGKIFNNYFLFIYFHSLLSKLFSKSKMIFFIEIQNEQGGKLVH